MTTLRKFAGFVPPEKNFFQMPNEWIDICAEIRDISELKVIQYILRHTWGFHEYGICKTISVDEFMQGRRRQDGSRMDKGTGLSEQSVRNGIKQAIEDGYLVCETDTSDAGRIKKSYTLKMVELEVQTLYPLQTLDPLNSRPQGTNPYTSDSQSLDPRVSEFIPRSEKDTIEKHYKKDTEERQEREVAHATARSQSSSQNDLSEDTEKREAVKPLKEDTNRNTEPPHPRKPPANKVPTPRRPRPQQQELTDEIPGPDIPEKAIAIMDRWDRVHKKPAPRTIKTIQAAQLLMVYDPSEDELRDCEKWLYTTDRPGKPWYRSHGVHLPDIAEKIGSWQSLQNAPPTKPEKEPSNEHKASNFYSADALFERNKWKTEAFLAEYEAKSAAKQEVQS